MTSPDAMTQHDDKNVVMLDALTCVIANEERFKNRLGVGADAFPTVKIAENVKELLGVISAASAGAGAATSATVAGAFFASGWMTTLGLTVFATTPAGWVVGAAVISGGAYYGVTRLVGRYRASRVDTIPRFLNSNIDLLGVAILDALGAVALRIAAADGAVKGAERACLEDYFAEEWGFDRDYARAALSALEDGLGAADLAACVQNLAETARRHPDCSVERLRKQLVGLLQEVAEADGCVCAEERELTVAVQRLLDAPFGRAGPGAPKLLGLLNQRRAPANTRE